MDSWQSILSTSNDWKSSELRVKTHPSSSEKLVEDVILLAVAIEKTRAENVHTNAGGVLGES